MAFVKKTWKNRISEYFNRYRLENVRTGEVSDAYINLNDGAVEEEGDKINAEALNDLEDRIEAALEGVGTGSNFVGTKAEWNALTDEEKAQYDTYDLTDDFEGYIVDNAVNSGSTNPVTGGAVANHLVADNKKFYFDYHDGEYGYNTSANRGADTFHPFSAGATAKIICFNNGGGGGTLQRTVNIPKGTYYITSTGLGATGYASGVWYYDTPIDASHLQITGSNVTVNNVGGMTSNNVAQGTLIELPESLLGEFTVSETSNVTFTINIQGYTYAYATLWLFPKSTTKETIPTEGIYGSKSYTASGYYSYTFALQGWGSSTQLTLNVARAVNLYLQNITSCELDGVSQTVTSDYWSPYTGVACDGNDHIITFTVKSGTLPTLSLNSSQGVVVNKAIFNK